MTNSSTPGSENSGSPLNVTLVGHSHLDAVWLWPWNATLHKAFRTFSKNLKRLDRYQGITFAQSTPLFYEWMEKEYPDLFREIQKMVKKGCWEIVGGMWVESDGYMPCGEAQIRQRMYGQRYFLEKFGRISEVSWIPDTFGMHSNHPQIIRKTGGKFFFTTKLAWNYENEFPYQHFIWESPDGSRVLALQSPVQCAARPGPHERLEESVKKHNVLVKEGEEAVVNYSSPYVPDEKRGSGFVTDVLSFYGEGDGGEGPSDGMCEEALSLGKLRGYENGSVHGHFERVEKKYADRLPVWKDELYLENHRGTTSSQARIKELNRKGEEKVITAEKWSSLTSAIGGCSASPDELEGAWKKLLFNQFHDILPGTSVAQVYVDAERDFDAVFRAADMTRDRALEEIASRIDTTLPDKRERRRVKFSTGTALILFNPLMWDRNEIVEMPWGYPGVRVYDTDNVEIPSQVIFRDGKNLLLFKARVPAFGYTQVKLAAGKKPSSTEGIKITGLSAETRFYRLKLDANGNMIELDDLELNRSLLSGPANRIRFFKNSPKEWSNWNIDPEYEKHELDSRDDAVIEKIDSGPVAAAFRITKPAPENGKVVQEIRLYKDHKRIDFINDIDVKYTESLVKAEFPFDVGAGFVMTETACGTHKRPVDPRTPFEKAMWEVWTQKWLDLSGPSCGVTVLNAAKYGFDAKGDRIRMTLVKGGIMPCSRTDVYTHRIRYALTSHSGSFQEAHAWKKGYEYNHPIEAKLEKKHGGDLPPERSFARLSADNICFEAFKRAEEGEGYVIRLFEAEGINTDDVFLSLPFEITKAEEIDFLELEALHELKIDENGKRVRFSMGHNEIKAIRIFPEGASS